MPGSPSTDVWMLTVVTDDLATRVAPVPSPSAHGVVPAVDRACRLRGGQRTTDRRIPRSRHARARRARRSAGAYSRLAPRQALWIMRRPTTAGSASGTARDGLEVTGTSRPGGERLLQPAESIGAPVVAVVIRCGMPNCSISPLAAAEGPKVHQAHRAEVRVSEPAIRGASPTRARSRSRPRDGELPRALGPPQE